MQNNSTSQTTTLQLVLAWSFAGIPLLAGVAQTLVNAMKLLKSAVVQSASINKRRLVKAGASILSIPQNASSRRA